MAKKFVTPPQDRFDIGKLSLRRLRVVVVQKHCMLRQLVTHSLNFCCVYPNVHQTKTKILHI